MRLMHVFNLNWGCTIIQTPGLISLPNLFDLEILILRHYTSHHMTTQHPNLTLNLLTVTSVCLSVLRVGSAVNRWSQRWFQTDGCTFFTECFQRDLLRWEETADKLWKRLTSVAPCAPLLVSGHFGAHPVVRNSFWRGGCFGWFSAQRTDPPAWWGE